MSTHIKISGPFIKQMHTGGYPNRPADSPLYAIAPTYNTFVPAPHRRINTIIQNQGLNEVTLGFDEDGGVLLGDAGIKLFAGQTMMLDNYNGPIHAIGDMINVTITESFA
jgi:hypothetical protein